MSSWRNILPGSCSRCPVLELVLLFLNSLYVNSAISSGYETRRDEWRELLSSKHAAAENRPIRKWTLRSGSSCRAAGFGAVPACLAEASRSDSDVSDSPLFWNLQGKYWALQKQTSACERPSKKHLGTQSGLAFVLLQEGRPSVRRQGELRRTVAVRSRNTGLTMFTGKQWQLMRRGLMKLVVLEGKKVYLWLVKGVPRLNRPPLEARSLEVTGCGSNKEINKPITFKMLTLLKEAFKC